MKREKNSKTIENQGVLTHRGWYRKRIIAFVLSVIMTVCLVPVMGKTEELHADIHANGGNGTSAHPYEISSYADLVLFAKIVNGEENPDSLTDSQTACAKLTRDIYCRYSDSDDYDTNWVPIGDYAGHNRIKFKGEFDGNNKKIIGLNNTVVGANSDYQGLFGYVDSSGKVYDVGIEESNIVGRDYVGAVAGLNNGQITGCYNTGLVTGRDCVGGVVGYNQKTVTDCYNTGEIVGRTAIGGVVGFIPNNSYIPPLTDCYNTGKVTGTSENVGGVVGQSGVALNRCYNTGEIRGSDCVGGIIGFIGTTGTITDCYNTGEVRGQACVGGIIGFIPTSNTGTVRDCYNIGAVTATDNDSYVGGIAGWWNGTLKNSYNAGMINGKNYAGGVVGSKCSGNVTNSYYDKSSSMVDKAIGDSESDSGTVIGLTTAQMTGADALSSTNMYFDYGNEENPWLVKADYSSGDTSYWYYPHLKGFNFDSQAQQLAAANIAPDAWPAKITTTVEPAGALSAEYNGYEQTLLGNVIQNAITVPTGFISKYCKYENDTFGTESEIIPTDPGLYKVILYKDDTAIGSHLFKILENGTDKDYTIAYYKKIGTDAESGDPVWSTGSVTVTDAGVYKAVISFKAKPNESITKEFEITPKAINVIAAGISKIYGDADPILLYTFDENSLLGTDGFRGNLSRVSGENTGEYDIEQNTLSAGGNYTINFTGAKFTINPKPLGSDAVRLSVGELDYNGTTVAPEVTVYDGESEVPASEYTVRFSNNVNVGTATVEVLDVNGGNYTVSGEKTYNIKKANVTVTALPQTVKQDSAISTGTELAVLTGAASGHYLSSVTLNSTSTSVADTTGTITASSAVIKDATGNDVTANYDITYNTGILTVIGKQSKIVTFKVENGAWDDGTTADKVVILNGYEGDSLKLAAKDIPAVGNKADKNFKEGSWKASTAVSTANISDTPEADKVIPADTVYTYTYAEKDRISATVSFKVVNGAWDDGTTADKVVILNGYEGDSLKLAAKDIPAVGNKPNENYKAGSWDAVPDVNKEFSNSESVVYTYTYAKDDTSSSKEEETTEEPEESSSSSSYSRNYYAYNIGTQPKTTNTNDGSNKNIKKVNNPDGSVTTITTIKNLDNSVTTVTETVDKDGNVTKVTETVKKYPSGGVKTNTKTEYPDGKVITNKKTEYSNGNVYSKTVEKDKNGNTVTTTTENTVIGSKGTKTFTSRTVNADGSHSKTYIKETASGKKTEKKYRFDAEGNGTYSEEKSNKNGVTYSQSFDITGTNAVLTAFFTTKKKVTIPKSILVAGIERLITAIAKGAFEGNITITNIKVEAGITTIGSKAFAGALNLKKLFLPSTIIKIGKNAFSGLLKLTIYISAKDKKAYDEAAEKLKKLLKKAGVDLSLITIKRDK